MGRRNSHRFSRSAVRAHFKGLTFPELAMAAREVDKMLIDRVAHDPVKARKEVVDFDRDHPDALLRLRP